VRAPERVRRLFAERLATLGDACDPGFGFDMVRLAALVTEQQDPTQTGLTADHSSELAHGAELTHLIDRFGARFGLRRIVRLVPHDSHIPEFAVVAVPAHAVKAAQYSIVARSTEVAANSVCSLPHANPGLPGFAPVSSGRSRVNPTSTGGGLGRGVAANVVFVATPLPVPPPQGGRERRGTNLRNAARIALAEADGEPASAQDSLAPIRPIRLFERPEPIEAMAEVPDGPPAQFTWRRVHYVVAHAEGPERIAMEWWRDDQGRAFTRDYFRVESREGVRVWIYREGLYGRETERPQWFLHGLFA